MSLTRHQLGLMKAAAAELVRLDAIGANVANEVLLWAKDFCASSNVPEVARRPSPVMDRLHEVLVKHQALGATSRICADETGWDIGLVSTTLRYMVNKAKRAAVINLPNRSRYFPTHATAEAAREEVMRMDALAMIPKRTFPKRTAERAERMAKAEADRLERKRIKAEQVEARRRERIEAQEARRKARAEALANKRKNKPKPHQAFTVNRNQPARGAPPAPPPPAPPKRAPLQSAIVPEHVKVQVLPHGQDTRYTPAPDAEGAGFMAEWRAKRAGAKTE